MRRFMLSNTRRDDLSAVMAMGRIPAPSRSRTSRRPPWSAPSSLASSKTAFVIAVKVYLPFLVIDIVIANVLLSMGMMVLPPVIISLPFKLMLFVLMDGWNLGAVNGGRLWRHLDMSIETAFSWGQQSIWAVLTICGPPLLRHSWSVCSSPSCRR